MPAKRLVLRALEETGRTRAAFDPLLEMLPLVGPNFVTHLSNGRVVFDSDKMRKLDNILFKLKRNGHRVLIYSQMADMLDLLEVRIPVPPRGLTEQQVGIAPLTSFPFLCQQDFLTHRRYGYMRLTGATKLSDQRDMASAFQTRNDAFVFLLNTRAGGLGLNLTSVDTVRCYGPREILLCPIYQRHCHVDILFVRGSALLQVIFFDSDLNPTMDQQAVDRTHRLGQRKPVSVYRLVTKGTVEERILLHAHQKRNMQGMVTTRQTTLPGKEREMESSEVVSLLLGDVDVDMKVRVRQMQDVKRFADQAESLERAKLIERRQKRSKLQQEAPKLERQQVASPAIVKVILATAAGVAKR